MRWLTIAVLVFMIFGNNCCSGDDADPAEVKQIKEILKDVHGHPQKVLMVSEEVSKLGDIAEPALISMFKDQQIENYKWRLEAATLLIGIKSDRGMRIVRDFMRQVAEAAWIGNFREMKRAFRNKLKVPVPQSLNYLRHIVVGLEDIDLYKKMLYAGFTGDDYVEIAFIKKKPKEVIPIIIEYIEGKEFCGMGKDSGGRLGLSCVIVKMQDYLDKDARARAREAIKKFNEEAYDGREEELINLLKELKE